MVEFNGFHDSEGTMNMLLEYVKNHVVLVVDGQPFNGQTFELIVDSPLEFVALLLENGYFISAINWWERARIAAGSKCGFGGPRDPKLPDEFFFSDTSIGREFCVRTTLDIYYDYLKETTEAFNNVELVPSFEVQAVP